MVCSLPVVSSHGTVPVRGRAAAAVGLRRLHPRRRSRTIALAADDEKSFKLAPSKPQTSFGQMMAYYLEMEPGLFEAAVESQFQRIRDEADAKRALTDGSSPAESPAGEAAPAQQSTDLALSGLNARIRDLEAQELRATVEDLMYMCVCEEFVKLGVGMLPKMDNYTDLSAVSLTPLMEGVHTREALDMVKEHMMSLLGQTALMPPTVTLKMSKLQMLQVYAASVMFGYFLRRVDRRYQLAKSLGMLPETKEDAVQRLERLFALADDEAAASQDSDSTRATSIDSQARGSDEAMASTASTSSNNSPSEASTSGRTAKSTPVLRDYISRFDEQTLRETARVMSKEGVNLLDRQSKALWGDAVELQAEMQRVIGVDASSLEEVMQRAEAAVQHDKVATITMSLSTQRRAVLEAVAFGTFLRDVETRVQDSYGLLTPLPVPSGPGGPNGLLGA